jgi:hypothetical protein
MKRNPGKMRRFVFAAVFLALMARPFRLRAQTANNDSPAPVGRATEAGAPARAAVDATLSTSQNATPSLASPQTLFVKVRVPDSRATRAAKPGQTIDGELTQPVYSGSQELFPMASRVTLLVHGTQRCRRPKSNRLPWVATVFLPRYRSCPTFESAKVHLAEGQEIPLGLSLISMAREKHIRAQSRKNRSATLAEVPFPGGYDARLEPSADQPRETAGEKAAASGLTLTFEAAAELGAGGGETSSNVTPPSDTASFPVLPAGTPAKVILLDSLGASKSRPGDVFRARLVEPVRDGATVVLPEGSLLEGRVAKVSRPRWLSRSGSMLLSFNRLVLPDGTPAGVSASVTGAQLDKSSETSIDPEGTLHGSRPGKLWMLINLGTTAGIAKVADDSTQLIIEAIVSTATDASTAGTARIVATCVSGAFMITRRGRDVVLPQYTEMDITFNRPFSFSPPRANLLTREQDAPKQQK